MCATFKSGLTVERKKNVDDLSNKSCRLFLTCDLSFDLTLHLQRVDKDAAVTNEAGAGYTSVWLTESLFIKILPTENQRKECREIIIQLFYIQNSKICIRQQEA